MRKQIRLSAEVLAKDEQGKPIPVLDEQGEPTDEFETAIKEWTIEEANLLMSIQRSTMLKSKPEATLGDDEESQILLSLFMVYAPLAACSLGDVPTFDEFVEELPEHISESWYAANRQLNPHWYTQAEQAAETEEEHKKK